MWSTGYDVALGVKHLFDVIQEVRKNEKSGIDKISAEEDAVNKYTLMKIFSWYDFINFCWFLTNKSHDTLCCQIQP